MIIDTHTHFYDPNRPHGVPWPPEDNELLYRTVLPEHHRSLSGSEGVTGTVVVEASAWLEDNQWILDLAAEDPWIVGLVGHVDPNRAEFRDEIGRLSANPLFRGIRPLRRRQHSAARSQPKLCGSPPLSLSPWALPGLAARFRKH